MRPKILICLLGALCILSTVLILVTPLLLIPALILLLTLLLCTIKILNESQTDTLTGVSNLRKLANLLHHYHQVRQLTVIYLDVNELKQLNDHQGHEIGNQALKEVAAFMLQIADHTGQVYRIGGDEFLLISEDADSQTLLQQWERNIAKLCHVGISYGFATGAGKDLEELIRTAEVKMYTMKNRTSPNSAD